jgi:F-type H+-transporting ATPase subunit gamma
MPGTAEIRNLRRRINSVQSTQQITRAMELIAASRIARARQAVEAARPYAEGINRVIRDVAATGALADNPLVAPHASMDRVGMIVVTSDRGLAGAYSANALRHAASVARAEESAGREIVHYVVGRKGLMHYRYRGTELRQSWSYISERPGYADAVDIGQTVMDDYRQGVIDRLWTVYTEFRSALTQIASSTEVLPVDPSQFTGDSEAAQGGDAGELTYEPDPEEILRRLLPRYVENQIFSGLLESAASEHASRQRAMKAATDNADEIIDDLTREANAARQAAITSEISEITAGAEALSE